VSRQIRIVPISQIKTKRAPYLIKGFLTAGASSVFYGPPKSRKSFLMFDMAMHIALGRHWSGCKVSRGPVVYCVAEGWHGIGMRIEAWCNHYGIDSSEVPLYAMEAVKLGKSDDDVDGIIAAIEDQSIKPVLIVIDTLARTMLGDENSTQDMGTYIKRIDTLRARTKAHVALVHHTGKDEGRGSRGSSALKGAVDTECPITRQDDLTVLGPPVQRDHPDDFVRRFEAEVVEVGEEDTEGLMPTSLILTPTDREPEPDDKPKGQSKEALELLWALLKTDGQKMTLSTMPEDYWAVSKATWRDEFVSKVAKSDNKDNALRGFHRIVKGLKDKGWVGEEAGSVWPVKDADRKAVEAPF